MATIVEVARRAGVSKSTVSRVLNGVPVSAGARLNVETAIKQLNYKPDAQARGLSLRRTNLVGVVVPEIACLFYGEILEGIATSLSETGFEMVLCTTENRRGRELALTTLLWSKRVDGLILVTPRELRHKRLQEIRGRLPIVMVDGAADGFNSITVDNFNGGFMATEHLLGLGHTRIGVITGPDTKECQDRLRGYQEALAKHGCRYDGGLIRSGDYFFESGRRAMEELLRLDRPPTAVFAASDLMAIGALKVLEERGIAVPNEISVVGFDGLEAGRWTTPTLTTVSQPLRQLGTLGGSRIVELIADREPVVTRIKLDCELVVRRSSGPASQASGAQIAT